MILLACIGNGLAAGNWAVLGTYDGEEIAALETRDTAEICRLIQATTSAGGEAVLRGTGGRLLGRWPGGPKVGEEHETDDASRSTMG